MPAAVQGARRMKKRSILPGYTKSEPKVENVIVNKDDSR